LWHVDPLLCNDREISKYTTAVTRDEAIAELREFSYGIFAVQEEPESGKLKNLHF
jgi:hypothetical protein